MKIGVLLSGCGLYDGTDVIEAALTLLALDRGGARAVCLAPDVEQLHAVNHLSGEAVDGERRSVLAESARIGRGSVRPLNGFWAGDLQGLVIPGGQGAPKTLLTGFLRRHAAREILPEIRALLDDLVARQRPLGAVGLGRDVLRAYFGGDLSEEDLSTAPTAAVVDEERRTLFTPGFLTGNGPAEVAAGIDAMVGRLLRMAGAGARVAR